LIHRVKPGTITYASQGIGSSAHMSTEQFRLAAGIDLVHVPYRGSAPALTDLVAGQVQIMFDNVQSIELANSGNVRAITVTAAERLSALPNVPTVAEAGFPNIVGGIWFTLLAPRGTPPAIVAYLNKEGREIFNLPDVRARLTRQGLELPLTTPDQFGSFLASEDKRWRDVITRAGIKFPQ
jgi:tripartite-type tricarboxylate transporter receptor subunit TctC